MPYTPHTKDEINEMINTIGLEKESDLFNQIPAELKISSLNLDDGLDEFSTFEMFKKLSTQNISNKIMFMGGGYYDHIVPSAVDALSSRSEFYTSYTPYQAEASQGTLQVLYEYQSMICELFATQVSNASMYDGASALAEAALMAVRITKRNKVLIDAGVNPTYIKVVQTYLSFRDIQCEVISLKDDLSDFSQVTNKIDNTVAAYLFQNPNFLGSIADFSNIVKTLHENKALAVISANPISMGMLKDPGSMDIDIVTADGQGLGNYLSFGGPSFGILSTKKQYIRNVPGRIIGKTLDKYEKEMFVLTMQAREQHIRRQRATSNICSNQNLLAVRSCIFLSLLGNDGLKEMASLCYNKSEYLKNELSKINNITIFNTADTFNEFVFKTNLPSDIFLDKLSKKGFYAGINLSNLYKNYENKILISVTEKRTKEDIDNLIIAIGEIL